MNIRESPSRLAARIREQPWRFWGRQIRILIQREVHRQLFTRRRIWVYVLALAPVLITALHYFLQASSPKDAAALQEDTEVLAGIVQFYYVRLGLFFACMGIFTWLFRGEMVERTLHYSFLSPVRREVLLVGKFLAGVMTAIVLFEVALIGCFYFIYGRFGSAGAAYMFQGAGLRQMGAYALVIALGALGYGAVFLGLSLLFKNPMVPGGLLLGWETITPILPRGLQMLSVTFYLKQLYPVRVAGPPGILNLFTVIPEPLPSYAAACGLVCFAALVVVFSCYWVRKTEITYTTD
jgi:ABC-type transport system involved in multi-copper enzyme maturation permease subunit